MKAIYIAIFSLVVLVSCKKNNVGGVFGGPYIYGTKDSSWINVDSCKTLGVGLSSYLICFDSLLNESRCPYGAMCPWAGYALARFKVTQGNTKNFITLATNNIVNYKSDTTLLGIKFHLDSLLPHPAINIFYQYSAYKAKVTISQ